jgi:hypothetical protein
MSICWIEVSVQSGRSCDRKALLVIRRREADSEMVPKIPSGCRVLLKQPSQCQFIIPTALVFKQKQTVLSVHISYFNIHDQLKFRGLCFKLPLSAI